MKRILILAGCPHATVTLYRCVHLQEQLTELGYTAVVQEWNEQTLQPAPVAAEYDLLVLQRVAMSGRLRQLLDLFHCQGKAVIFDTDDLVFEPAMIQWHRGAQQLSAQDQALYADGVRRYQATLAACDYVLTASPLLAELAQRHGKPAFVHRNAVGREMQQQADQLPLSLSERGLGGEVIIGYGSGTPTHDVDFAEAVPALLDILSHYPQVQLWLAGPLALPTELAVFGPRIRRFPLQDWRGYLELASHFTIALAPLEEGNIFCRAKSEIKWMEAGLLGIPTVASRVDPFLHAIDPGETGLLAGNTAEWIAALDQLISKPELRQQIGAAAQRKVAEQYGLTRRVKELGRIMEQIQAGAIESTQDADDPRLHSHQQTSPPPSAPPLQIGEGAGGEVPLLLNWIVTEPFHGSGGHLGIFRMVKHLVEFGHECHLYIVPIEKMHDSTPAQLQQFVDLVFMRTGAHFHRWSGRVYDADATIATHWSTVAQLLSLPNPGQRFYFVQDFEPYFYPMGSDYVRAEQTYRQGLHCVTLGPWLAKLMREQYHGQADHFDFAVDSTIYWPQPTNRPAHPRVTFYARPSTPRRAYEIGLAALEQVKARQPEVEVIFYGANQLDPHPNFHFTNLGIRNQYELATHYSSCDVGLAISLTNPSFVPFELMACKCAVVDIASERVAGLLTHGENALLAEPTPEGIANAILQLIWDKEQRQQLIERAYAQVRNFTWTDSARQLERALLCHAPPPSARRLHQRGQGQGADALLWQIHQLIDQQRSAQDQVAQLETTLQRALAEKAALAQQLHNTETLLQQQQQAQTKLGARVRQIGDQMVERTPGWQIGPHWANKLPIGPTPLQQRFRATQSHLAQITLYFAQQHQPPTGEIHVALYEGDLTGRQLLAETILAAAVQPDQPCVLTFPAQTHAYERDYLLVISQPPAAPTFSHALWRYLRPLAPTNQLQRGGVTLRGQLAFAPGYATPGLALPVPTPANLWANPPQPLPTVWRATASQGMSEGLRLTRKTITAVRAQGLRGLGTELINYLRWQLKK